MNSIRAAGLKRRARPAFSSSRTAVGHSARELRHVRKPRLRFEWTQSLSDGQWDAYRAAIHALRDAGVGFLIGGGFALAIYSGRWRDTKDIDFYIRVSDREAAIEALTRVGFVDYFGTLPYDRKWIYRSTRSGVIVDLIWAMANQRAQVDEHWFTRATPVSIRGEPLHVIPMEEFVWCKVYILQRDHCDWTDVMNVLYVAGPRMNWEWLLTRLEDDWAVLKALLTLYSWLCPGRARELPSRLRSRMQLDRVIVHNNPRRNRIRLLDTRGWFAALLPPDKPLEI
jgi:hypothetical protein